MGGNSEREQEILEALDALLRLDTERERRLSLLDTHAVLRALTERIRHEYGFEVSLAGLVEDRDLVLRIWSGTRNGSLHDLPIPLGLGLGGRVVSLGRPVVVGDYCRSDRITHDFDTQVNNEGVASMVGLPIGSGTTRGVLYGATRNRAEIGDNAVDGLRRLARLATLAVDVADGAATLADTSVVAERQRIAESLHDSVGAMLFGIGSSLRQLQTEARESSAVAEQLARIEQQLSVAGSALRESVSRLREAPPSEHDPSRLTAELAESVRSFERRTGVAASFVPVGLTPQLDPERTSLLVRTVGEALLNVEKHAPARSVVVTLAFYDDRVSVAVMNDGAGSTPSDEPESFTAGTGAGLPGLRARVERVGGSLRLSRDEDGTTLRCDIPLPRPSQVSQVPEPPPRA
ncbi:signal transduction histidine kinase [Streptomyces sp. V4I23]|uniref:GAF domain-containing sensor histidine kinase n=1 Tax=Streptomyces sp. V4I23 TaxID=3042282 RepID=UPI0027837568|nr:ATP-binding protein [Streptomyces sp. V4I23]MDQ1012125.1 signal transduction histidine kinase [Streptomyces sp. V4I23]